MNHVGLTIADTDRSLRFWRDTLGLEIETERSSTWSGAFPDALTGNEGCSLRITMLTCDNGARIQLEEFLRPASAPTGQSWTAPGGGHICLEVQDIFAITAAATERGYTIISRPAAPVPLPSSSGLEGGYMMGLKDPDGHIVELLELPRT